MRAKWKDAPRWAQWLARDPDGSEWWYEADPRPGDYFYMWMNSRQGAKWEMALASGDESLSYEMTKEPRPT